MESSALLGTFNGHQKESTHRISGGYVKVKSRFQVKGVVFRYLQPPKRGLRGRCSLIGQMSSQYSSTVVQLSCPGPFARLYGPENRYIMGLATLGVAEKG